MTPKITGAEYWHGPCSSTPSPPRPPGPVHLEVARHPGQEYIRAAGSLGWGLPAALGAQVAQPGRPVVLFTGDGGLWYHIAELEMAARRQIPAVIVINNDGSLNQEINPYTAAYGGSLHGRQGELWHFRETDFARVTESMGVLGLTVEKAADFEATLHRALASNGPAVINVVTDMEALAPRGATEPAPPGREGLRARPPAVAAPCWRSALAVGPRSVFPVSAGLGRSALPAAPALWFISPEDWPQTAPERARDLPAGRGRGCRGPS